MLAPNEWEAFRRISGKPVVMLASGCERSLRSVGREPPVTLPPLARWLESESGGGGHHRRPSGVHGGDDLLGVDALQVDARGAEVGVPELALDDVERHAFAGELDGVGMAQLMRREAPPDTRLGGEPTELDADSGARPGPASGRAV